MVEIPLQMHGVISYLDTRLPIDEEIEHYLVGQFQSVELTGDVPWEPYSATFATRETALRLMSAVNRASSCPENPVYLTDKAEEMINPRRPLNLYPEECCVAVVNWMALTQTPIELSNEEDLATRLIVAVNVTVEEINGDGLFERPKDSVCTSTEEDRAVFSMLAEDRDQ
jgi:hypothetical protein